MDIAIREARPDEAEWVLPGYEWLFAPPGGPPPDWDPQRAVAALRRAIGSPTATVLVATDGAALAGLCCIQLDIDSVRFGQRAWIEDLAVDPERRSLGVGKRLLDAAKAWAREHGATHVELDSVDARVDAHRFYERERPSWRSRSFGWRL